jgi:hypothetical protein
MILSGNRTRLDGVGSIVAPIDSQDQSPANYRHGEQG